MKHGGKIYLKYKTGSLEILPRFILLFFKKLLLHRWISLEVYSLVIQGSFGGSCYLCKKVQSNMGTCMAELVTGSHTFNLYQDISVRIYYPYLVSSENAPRNAPRIYIIFHNFISSVDTS